MVSFPQVSPPKPCIRLSSPPPHTRYTPSPSHSSRFDHPNNIWWGVQSLSSSLRSFLHYLLTSSLLSLNILLTTLLSNTASLRSSLNVGDQVSHPYKTKGKIIVLYILIFKCLDSKLEEKGSAPSNSKHYLTATWISFLHRTNITVRISM